MSGQEQHEYTASLRVFSESLAFADLVAVLGEPTKGHDIGDLVSPRRSDGPRRTSAHWCLRSAAPRTQPLDEHIAELITFVEVHSREFGELEDKVQIDVFCGVFTGDDSQGGFTLGSDLIRRLGDLNLDVGFDLY